MKGKYILIGLLMAAVLLLAAGCAGGGAPAAAPAADTEEKTEKLPAVTTAKGEVVAEGVVEPEHWSELSLAAGGEVIEITVQEGDAVAAGAPLLRLDTNELQIALQSAQQDVVAQKAALDRLLKGATDRQIARAAKDNADQIAQAEVTLQAARLQLEKVQAEDPAAAVDAAQSRIKQLKLQLDQVRAQDPVAEIAAAQVVVERAQIALADAQDEYNKALDRPWEDQGIRDGWARQVTQKKLDLRQAEAQLAGAQSARRANAIGVNVLAAQIEDAETQLEQALAAQEAYAIALQTLDADVQAAQLRLDALRAWENPYLDRATEEEVSQAESRLKQAELAVSRLQLEIEDATLYAPFAGTIVDVYVEQGDRAGPGQVVMVIAALDQLVVRTTDLTELDIAQITEGQSAIVTVDAIEQEEFRGTVSEISLRGEDYRGDVVYEVTIELADVADVPLRWGMTAMAKIDTR
jgi:multidrug efflux pump subunit AcrA (membrane-fusion protein)